MSCLDQTNFNPFRSSGPKIEWMLYYGGQHLL